jgi:hypothetical protein
MKKQVGVPILFFFDSFDMPGGKSHFFSTDAKKSSF